MLQPKLVARKCCNVRRYYSLRSPDNPTSNRRIYQPNMEKLSKLRSNKKPHTMQNSDSVVGPRINKLNMQMLSSSLHRHVFQGYHLDEYSPEIVESCLQNLHKHSIKNSNQVYTDDIDFKLPPLEGANLDEHFRNIGTQQSQPYVEIIKAMLIKPNMPNKPAKWEFKPGWTIYRENHPPVQVDYPEDDILVFDVEVCMSAGKAPTLATAMGKSAWYGWVSEQLVECGTKTARKQQYQMSDLIPLETSCRLHEIYETNVPRVVVGHNVSYDRSKVKEQYWHQQTALRFVDTMSLHICISGLTSYQRAMLKSENSDLADEEWTKHSSLNNLRDVLKLYCGDELEKEPRNMFINGNLQDIKNNFDNLMNYCAGDVVATYKVLGKVFPEFMTRFPHPVTFAGMLELGTAYLPVNSNWERYVSDSKQIYRDLEDEGKFLLTKRADQACQLLHEDKFKYNIWMWDQDWDVKELKLRKKPKIDMTEQECSCDMAIDPDSQLFALEQKFKFLNETKNFVRDTFLSGHPNWYRKLCVKLPDNPEYDSDWTPGVFKISTSMQITPKLLSLTWEGFPLHYIKGQGWGFLVPFSRDHDNKKLPLQQLLEKCPIYSIKPDQADGNAAMTNLLKEVEQNLSCKEYYSRVKSDKTEGLYKGSGIWCNTVLEDCVFFLRLPHKDGASKRVGNPLAKDFLSKFSENVLAGDTASAEKVLDIARKLSYWRNNRDRIGEQMIVWLDREYLPKKLRNSHLQYGAIVPHVVVCGTLTRRAVEATWMTASNARRDRIGSELRAMVQAPPGYSIVGADVDSQELWIASVIGDASYAKMHGATPFGWMTVIGSKADGTDMHSVTANAVGISRDHAKVINYARIYGAGQNFAERLLSQFNPSMSNTEARSKAVKMFELTKGKCYFQLKQDFVDELPDKLYTKWQAFQLAKMYNKRLSDVFLPPKWAHGSESAMFNRLEAIAREAKPITPFLNGRLSRALESTQQEDQDRFLPTKINWVVQSGAVDFLHLMLVNMRWLLKGSGSRFCLSFHDEVRYLVPDELKYRAALAMHVTNLYTRAFCSLQLGIADLPQSVAFFGGVEIDQTLRKEAKDDCVTPSNPYGLHAGYGIPHGMSLNVNDAIVLANGQKHDWYKMNQSFPFSRKPSANNMSKATKRKHVLNEVQQDDFSLPTPVQQIVKVIASRGNNLHEVSTADGVTFLASMPTKFRRNVWVKRGDFVLVEPIAEGDKVKAEMVRVLTRDHIKYIRQDGEWPSQFDTVPKKQDTDEEGLFVNTNHVGSANTDSDTDDLSGQSDEDTSNESDSCDRSLSNS